jgi:hypothetical protein
MTMGKQNLAGREIRQHMGAAEATLHAIMIVCTIGMWYPVYRHRKNKLARTTNVYLA